VSLSVTGICNHK
jgi:hypothetical protein